MLPKEKFISPFRPEYTICWNKKDSCWEGAGHGLESSILLETAKIVEQLGLVSELQLCKAFNSGSLSGARSRVRKYAAQGYLLRHRLESPRKIMVVYTVGPAGARLLNRPYDYNWWLEMDLPGVLRRLVFSQLFLRIYSLKKCVLLPAKYPLAGGVGMAGGISFPVAVVRGDIDQICAALENNNMKRIIVICEEDRQIQIIGRTHAAARCTTDYDLCCTPLSDAFYYCDGDVVVRDKAGIFEE